MSAENNHKSTALLYRAIIWLFIFIFSAVTPIKLRAEDVMSSFEGANKFYEQGKFGEAVSAYDKLIAAGNVSEAVYFNRGNALFKMGRTGMAIASYLQAQRLAPRDPELSANLQLARTRGRGGSEYSASRLNSWLGKLSLNEWAMLTAAAFWFLFLALAMGQWRPLLRRRLKSYLLVSAFAVIAFGICLAVRINSDVLTTSAVVVVGEADVRNGPLDESQSIFKVRDGVELEVTDKKDGWLEVSDPAQRSGWLREESVLVLNNRLTKAMQSVLQ